MAGSLDGCWYTYVSDAKVNPSGTYQETGTELFVGCLNGTTCGQFTTTYTFTGKFTANFEAEIHGRCQHPVTGTSTAALPECLASSSSRMTSILGSSTTEATSSPSPSREDRPGHEPYRPILRRRADGLHCAAKGVGAIRLNNKQPSCDRTYVQ